MGDYNYCPHWLKAWHRLVYLVVKEPKHRINCTVTRANEPMIDRCIAKQSMYTWGIDRFIQPRRRGAPVESPDNIRSHGSSLDCYSMHLLRPCAPSPVRGNAPVYPFPPALARVRRWSAGDGGRRCTWQTQAARGVVWTGRPDDHGRTCDVHLGPGVMTRSGLVPRCREVLCSM